MSATGGVGAGAAEMVGTRAEYNLEIEPAVNYFEELNPESLAHILRCLESKEIGVVSRVCREFNTVLMGRNGAAGFTIRCVEKGTGKKWGDRGVTAVARRWLEGRGVITSKPLWRLLEEYQHEASQEPLLHLGALTRLGVQENQITDIGPLQHLTALTRLYLGGNQIADVGPLQHLTALTRLGLGENQIADIGPLQHLTALTRLCLPHNQIADIGPLQHLTALTELNLQENQIADTDPTVVLLKSRGCSVRL